MNSELFYRGAGLWDFTLMPVEFVKKLEKNGLYRLTGTFGIGGVPVHVEILTGIRFGRIAFAVGFSFDKESYGALAEKLSGIGVDFLNVIGLDLEVVGSDFFKTIKIGFLECLQFVSSTSLIHFATRVHCINQK